MSYEKGKKNKFNIGDTVQMTPERVKWEVEHMCEMNLVGGTGEFQAKDLPFITGFFHAHLTQKMPKGVVVGYGSTAEGPSKDDPNKWVEIDGENCIKVQVKLKYGKHTHFYHERNFIRVKKAK